MKKRSFIILSLIVLLSFQILAVDIQLRKGGEELDYVSYGLIKDVDVNIILDSEFSELTVDLSSLDTNDISVSSSACSDDSGVFRCIFRRDIRIVSATATINVIVDDVSFEVVTTFIIDNDAPVLNSITTDYCLADKCYLKPGPGILYLDISEGGSGLDNANIWLSILGSQVKAYLCEGNICKVAVTVPETNLLMPTIIPWRSTDDAGFLSSPYSNVITGLSSETIYVDRGAPEIIEFNISSSSGIGLFSVDESLIVTVVVKEEKTEPRIFLDMSNFGIDELIEGSCSLGEIDWDCEVMSDFGIDFARTDSFNVIVKDLVNNFDNYTEEIEVLGLTGTEEPSNWNLAGLQISPSKINKRNLMLNRNIHSYLTLLTAGNAEIIDVDNEVTCFSGGADGSSNADLQDMHVINPGVGERSFYIKGLFLNNLDNYEGFDFVNYSCYMEVLSKKGDKLESNYEKIWFDFEIKFDQKSRVDLELINKLNSSRLNLEKYQETISELAKWVRIAKGFCAGSMLLDTVSSVFAGGTGAAAAAEQKGLQATFGRISEVSGKSGEKLHWACNVVNCNYTNSAIKQMTGIDVNSNTDSLVNSLPGIDYFKKAADVNDIAPVLDPYRSIIVAGVTMCLPALVLHAETLLVNECHYAGCLERSAYLGMPSGTCDMSKSYNQCLFVSGAVLDAVPYTALIRVLSSKLAQITEDPYGFIAAGAITLVCSNEAADFLVGKKGGILYSACMVANKVTQLGKIVPIYNNIKSNFLNPTAQSKCDSLASGYSFEQLTWELSHKPTEFEDFTNTYELDNGETMTCGFNGCVYGDFLIKFNLEFEDNPKYIVKAEIVGAEYDEAGKLVKGGTLQVTTDPNEDPFLLVPDDFIDPSDMEFFVIQEDGTAEYIAIDSAWQTLVDIIAAQGGVLQVDTGQPIPGFDPDTVDITRLTAKGNIEEIDEAFGTASVAKTEVVESIETLINNDKARELFKSMGFIQPDGSINNKNIKNIKFFKDAQKQGFIDIYIQYQKAIDLGTGAEFMQYQYDQAEVATINAKISDKKRTIVEIRELGEDINDLEAQIDDLDEELDTTDDDDRRSEIIEENDALFEKLVEATESYKEATKAGDIDDLEEEIKNWEGTLEAAEKTEQKSGKFFARKILHHTVHGDFLSLKTWGNFLDLGMATSVISGLFRDQTEEDWLDDVQDFVRIPAEFEKQICKSNLESPEGSGSVMVASRSGLMPAAMLYGSRAKISSSEWEYIIAVDIQNLKEDGLKFNIILEEPASKDIVLNNEGDTTIELAEQISFTKKGMGALYFSEDTAYSRVCIKFLNSNLGVYFDDFSLPNNKLCQELIIE